MYTFVNFTNIIISLYTKIYNPSELGNMRMMVCVNMCNPSGVGSHENDGLC